ncbi:hypothetical protein FOZ60_015070 [Perkinsus olseni]|uniref:CCHC-type domain-containing protein n=1 Tax=Perkinsus olseni TaxID=32597 RepID=A0A7J6N948_PEROL|nr:hypothetical protein FOZ60_015070 [Perkinsus olseni]
MPEKITDWLDGLGFSSIGIFPAIRLGLRRWARKNEKALTPSRTTQSAKVQVSVANPADEEISATEVYMVMGSMDRGACWRCGQRGHIAFECTNEVFKLRERCQRCGGFDHFMDTCPLPDTFICGRCKQSGHYSSVCGAPSPVKKFYYKARIFIGGSRSSGQGGPVSTNASAIATDKESTVTAETGDEEVIAAPVMKVGLTKADVSLGNDNGIGKIHLQVVPHAMLEVTVKEKPLQLLVDRGGGTNFISKNLAARLVTELQAINEPLAIKLSVVCTVQ